MVQLQFIPPGKKGELKLHKFEFPELSGIDYARPLLTTIPELFSESVKRGFYMGDTPYNKIFQTLYDHGGRVSFYDEYRAFTRKAWIYIKCLMRSEYAPYKEKEAVCAMLLSEIVYPIIIQSPKIKKR